MNIFNMDSQASEYVTGLDGRVYQSNGHDISQLGQTGDFQLQEIKIPANVLSVARVAMLMFGQATGTCRWWGNLTPPCWGGGLSLACDGRAWGGSLSWTAAERWWGGPEPEEGWHLRDQARDTWTIGQRQTNKQDVLGQGLTCLRYWMSSRYWNWFGDGGIAANVTLRDLRGKFKNYLISIHFRMYFSKVVFICTRLSLLGDGRSRGCRFESWTYDSSKKVINKDVFVCFPDPIKGLKHFDDAHFFGCNHWHNRTPGGSCCGCPGNLRTGSVCILQHSGRSTSVGKCPYTVPQLGLQHRDLWRRRGNQLTIVWV